jgi:hypothetical protein
VETLGGGVEIWGVPAGAAVRRSGKVSRAQGSHRRTNQVPPQ